MSDFVENPQYKPRCARDSMAYLVEECGELIAALGKAQRWGLASCNPELAPSARETNREWIKREMKDVEQAIGLLREKL